jgi:hypothetical protein
MAHTHTDDLIAEAITEAFGARCTEYDKDCWVCRAWQQYDDQLNALKAIRKEARKGRPNPDIIFQEANNALARDGGTK